VHRPAPPTLSPLGAGSVHGSVEVRHEVVGHQLATELGARAGQPASTLVRTVAEGKRMRSQRRGLFHRKEAESVRVILGQPVVERGRQARCRRDSVPWSTPPRWGQESIRTSWPLHYPSTRLHSGHLSHRRSMRPVESLEDTRTRQQSQAGPGAVLDLPWCGVGARASVRGGWAARCAPG